MSKVDTFTSSHNSTNHLYHNQADRDYSEWNRDLDSDLEAATLEIEKMASEVRLEAQTEKHRRHASTDSSSSGPSVGDAGNLFVGSPSTAATGLGSDFELSASPTDRTGTTPPSSRARSRGAGSHIASVPSAVASGRIDLSRDPPVPPILQEQLLRAPSVGIRGHLGSEMIQSSLFGGPGAGATSPELGGGGSALDSQPSPDLSESSRQFLVPRPQHHYSAPFDDSVWGSGANLTMNQAASEDDYSIRQRAKARYYETVFSMIRRCRGTQMGSEAMGRQVETLCSEIPAEDWPRLMYISLLDEDIAQAVGEYGTTTLAEAIVVAANYEQQLRAGSRAVSSGGHPVGISTGSSQKKSLEKLTPEQRRTLAENKMCFRCRRGGHFAKDCPFGEKARRTAASQQHSAPQPQGSS